MRNFEESGVTGNVQETCSNLVELLMARANESPGEKAYVFLADGETESGRLTYADLDRRARAIAARLQAIDMAGERALLLYPPGLDYIEAFFGCLYASVIAVPAYPPTRQHLPRLQAVIRDAAPTIIMTTAELAAKLRDEFVERAVSTKFAGGTHGAPHRWLTTDTLTSDQADGWRRPALAPESLAFLQYTSGSTGDPKGVMVSHGNLLANQEAIRQGFGHTEHSTVVGWLPLYHDMGLIGNILQPLYVGSSAILMPPMAFLEKPVRWLKAISEHRAATSGGPNFAYDLCVRKVTADQKRELDLSCWTLAFNGSEPVRAATLERFSRAFAECGFRRESFFPCYGLAEATLFVTGARLEAGEPRLEEKFDRTDFNDCSSLGSPVSSLVSCGLPADGHTVWIVDPATATACPPGREGEIWVSGPSVAQGFWNRPEESENTFRARLETGGSRPEDGPKEALPRTSSPRSPASFLRTGDLGMLDNGRLYVTGRIKDLIIIRGRNVYPQDIEHVLTDTEENLSPGGCAAFSVIGEGEEHLVVVAELSREAVRKADYQAVFASMRRTLVEVCELTPSELVLVRPGGVPKTTSGKLRRQACKHSYLEGRLPIVAKSGGAAWANTDTLSFPEDAGGDKGLPNSNSHAEAPQQFHHRLLREALFAVPQPQRVQLIAGFLSAEISRLLKITGSFISTESPLRSFGLDSLKAVELKHAVDNLLGIEAPLTLFLSDQSVTEVAEVLAGHAERLSTVECTVRTDADQDYGVHSVPYTDSSNLKFRVSDLSATQLSMWAMQHMEPDSIVYNLHLALRIESGVDAESLRRAFHRLAERHEMLRTVYCMEGDKVVQRVLPLSDLPEFFTTVDATTWSEPELQDDMARRVREPFDLARGPVLRATLYLQGAATISQMKRSEFPEIDVASRQLDVAHTEHGGMREIQFAPQTFPNTLLLCAHHIALDLWSVLILVEELRQIHSEPVASMAYSTIPDERAEIRGERNSIATGYVAASSGLQPMRLSSSRVYTGGEQPVRSPPTSTYADFVTWQQNYLQSVAADSDWDYWRRQLAGELPILALPTDHPRPAVPDYRGASVAIRLSREETSQLKELARRNSVTLFTVLLTAYKVLLHRYTHQTDLIVGVPTAGRSQARFASVVGNFVNPVPLRSRPSGDKPFSVYLSEVHDALVDALKHQNFPFSLIVERLQVRRNADHWPIYHTLFVLQQAQTGVGSEVAQLALGEDSDFPVWADLPVCSLAIQERVENFDVKLMAAECRGGLQFSFQYRSDLFEAGTIANHAAQFQRLLAGIVAGPDTRLSDLPLLSAADLHRLTVEWNNTEIEYAGASCIHRLFEEQAERTPDAIALVYEDRQLSYRELNEQANRLAHGLIQRGVRPDTPVGICAERSIEMVIGMLGVLKAGGAYLPLDPDYPKERLQAMLEDARTNWILMQSRFADCFPAFSGEILRLDAEFSWLPESADHNPDLSVAGESLAYVLFTSGSTGRPKGVGIPHAGVRNRLLWMQQRFRLDGSDAVLQKTPYSFDVSVWEFFWPLLAGARLVMLDPGAHKEPERLAAAIRRHHITTVHFVPSMLGAFLDTVDIGLCRSLRRVICSGEALSTELQKRFFERSGAELHNLYGPTEASIDVTAWACERGKSAVPIGHPIANTRIYLLDACLNPVPIGVPGELYIGGVQLARGYLNRPDLTAERFLPNPFGETGGRLYRTGDLARFRSDGAIEYLGRIDQQVKIRGFRIELGEIEAKLREHASIREAVAIVREDYPGDRRLVAYLVSDSAQSVDTKSLREFLGKALPEYMIPAAFVLLDKLPVTANGKLNRKALPMPNIGSQFVDRYVAPRNPTEKVLAEIWAELLRVERVGIHDNFFGLAGDSILAIQVVSRARQAGLHLTPRQLFQHQTVAELAAVAGRTECSPSGYEPVSGEVPLSPIQRWFFDLNLQNRHHWNQAVLLEVRMPLDPAALERAVHHLIVHHDALRFRFTPEDGDWRQTGSVEESPSIFRRVNLSGVPEAMQTEQIEAECTRWQASLNLGEGPLLRAVWFDLGESRNSRLLIVVHHLVVDGVSWRILLEDLQTAYRQIASGETVALPPKTMSFQSWSERLQALAQSEAMQEETHFWRELTDINIPSLPVDFPEGANLERHTASVVIRLNPEDTTSLLYDAPAAYRTEINDLLLTALAQTLSAWNSCEAVLIDVEGHGREDPFEDVDLSRTVGWFTTLFPVRLSLPPDALPGDAIKAVKEQLRRIPRRGIGYGVLRYLAAGGVSGQLQRGATAPILFNYLGQFDQALKSDSLYVLAREPVGTCRDPNGERAYEIEVNARIVDGRLTFEWHYSTERYRESTVRDLAKCCVAVLRNLIAHCLSPGAGGLTPSDFPLASLSQAELDALPFDPRNIEDIYPLSSMQEGMLFDTLLAPHSGIYLMQDRFEIRGEVDENAFMLAWQRIVDRQPALRTAFIWESVSHPCQIVFRRVELPFEYLDWRGVSEVQQDARLEHLLEAERKQGFNLTKAPMMAVRLIRLEDARYCFVRSYHHILVDAWCMSLILVELKENYEDLVTGRRRQRPPAPPFSRYIAWLQERGDESSERFWRDYLKGFSAATPIPVSNPAPVGANAEPNVRDAITFLFERETRDLNALAQRYRLTPNTFIQAAWALMLSRYSGSEEVLFGVTVAGRPTDLPNSDTMLGVFINSLPLRVRVRPEQYLPDFLDQLLRQNIELRQYEYAPLLKIQGWSDIPRGMPLFESLLVFENYPVEPSLRSGDSLLNITDVKTRTHTNYPLNGVVIPGDRLHLQMTYHTNKFNDATVERMLGHFKNLLLDMIRAPEKRLADLDMLGEDERRQIIEDWNRTEYSFPPPCDFVAQFERQVEQTPNAIAVACQGERLTYRELNSRANRLAHGLALQGVGPEAIVALLSDRGIGYAIMMLGVFKAGGAYLPLDPAHPDERLMQVLRESGARWVLASASQLERAQSLFCNMGEGVSSIAREGEGNPAAKLTPPTVLSLERLLATSEGLGHNPSRRHTPDNLAFVIFTSGSTGTPKGAMVEHRGMFNNLITKVPTLRLTETDVIAQTAGQCFDISVWQHLTPLACGARVEIFPDEIVREPGQLLSRLAECGVTVLEAVPSMIQTLLDIADDALGLPRLRWLIACGEAFPPELCRRWMDRFPHVEVLNAYGPAECSDDVSYYAVQERPGEWETTVPVGYPVENTRLYLLDRWLDPVPVGVPGEICVAGIQVGRGYLHRPELTAERFVPDPFNEALGPRSQTPGKKNLEPELQEPRGYSPEPGSRLYRTGDLGRYRPDGSIEFLGRLDHQLKLRGFRIEPGEIEAQLLASSKVNQAVVVAREDSRGRKHLVAYVVCGEAAVNNDADLAEELRADLSSRLPNYMVPSAFVRLDTMPLSANGKIDRKTLPTPHIAAQREDRYIAPRNPTEETLASIWEEVLDMERVGVNDNFFDLGGHSLLAVQVLSRVRSVFGVDIPLRTLFETTTIEQLAEIIEELLIRQLDSLSEEEAQALLESSR